MRLRHFVAALALAAGGMSTAQAGIINGGFEAGGLSGWGVFPGTEIVAVAGSDYIPCCGVTGTAAQLANHFAAFGGGNLPNISTLSQIFDTVTDQRYVLSFDAGALGGGNQTSFVDLFEADGGRLIASNSAVLTANNNLGSTFRHFTLAFTAASGITRVAFRVDPFTDSVDGILDNVSVSAVPEPAAWALMLFGFILVGGAMRRRAPMTAVAA